ncbi:MAG: hypothetical protein HS115_17830 [Spirochaetales bacterium]|nr:hypothetical protein [Spirochaetales bacterium]
MFSKVLPDTHLKEAFTEIFNGAMILTIAELLGDQFEQFKVSMGPKTIYLDTNVVFRLLGLQDSFLNRLGAEFLEIVSNYDIQLKIMDRTLHELQSTIRAYRHVAPYIARGGKVSHLFQVMKNRGLDPADLTEFIIEQKEKLRALHITVDTVSQLSAENSVYLESQVKALAERKLEKRDGNDAPDQYVDPTRMETLARHDLAMLLLVPQLRRATPEKNNHFGDTEYFFVTSDTTALRFQNSLGDAASVGIPAAISDSAMSFMLYFHLTDAAKHIASESFTLALYNDKTLSLPNWLAFVKEAEKSYKHGRIDKAGLGFLMSRVALQNKRFRQNSAEEIVNSAIDVYERTLESTLQQSSEQEIEINQLKSDLDEMLRFTSAA